MSSLNRFLEMKLRKDQSSKIKDDGVEIIFAMPYVGLTSPVFSKKIKATFKRYFWIDVRIVFGTCKVQNYFSLKCRTPLPLMANIVYKFQCSLDATCVYIGKTMRHLATRVKEHGTSASAIHDHLLSCTSCHSRFSCNSFSIIDSGNTDFEITIKEALHIRTKKPALNKQLYTQGTSFVLNLF